MIQTVTTFDTDRSSNGDRFDQTFNANYIKATIGLCNLHLLCKRGPKHGIIQGGRTRSTLIIFKGSTCAGLFGDKSRAAEWVELRVIKLLFKSNPHIVQTPQIEYVFLTLRQTVCRFLRNAYEALNLGHRLYRAAKFQIWGCVYIVCGSFSI